MSFCTITIHKVGPSFFGKEFTVEIESSYDQTFIDEFKDRIKPVTERRWDGEAKRWWTMTKHLMASCKAALNHFETVEMVEGRIITNLRTEESREQLGLFG